MPSSPRRPRWTSPFLALAVLLVALAVAPAGASDGAAALARFQLGARTRITPAVPPLIVGDGRRVEVMVRLDGKSVAERRAVAPGRRLSSEARAQAEGELTLAHAAAETRVVSAGGR